ncbi:MAG: peptidylprolyl isomerase [Planctomycetota bacterium]|jgi:cyclophilin family peptidyl-prolyl cis-trans isomerase
MTEPESKRQDRFETFVRKVIRKADENRNYAVGAVVAVLLVGAAIYFKVASDMRVKREAWESLADAESVGILREKWKKYSKTPAGYFLAQELAIRLFDEQKEMADKEEEDVNESRLSLLEEGITVLNEAIELHQGHPFETPMMRLLETFRLERDWIQSHGAVLLAAKEPVPKMINPKPEKSEKAAYLDDKPGQLPIVTFKTDLGEIVVELYEDDAPNHVANFISLVLEGFYDGLIFHRVEDWVIQTGCPDGNGGGGPGYRIKAEITKHKHDRGAFGMARSQDMDSAGSQVYFVKTPQHNIDGQYTIFGRVLTGMDVVDRMQKGDKLLEIVPDRIRRKTYQPKVIQTGAKPAQ